MINLLLLLAVIFWGLSFVATKMVLQFLSPIEIIAIRLLLGIPVLYLVLKFKKKEIRFMKNDYLIIILASIILGAHFLIQAIGMIYTTATNTAWLVATIPVFIAILSYFFLNEKMTANKIMGIIIATLGVVLLVSGGRLATLGWLKSVGDWIILSSSVTWAIYTIITRNITRRYNPLVVSLGLFLLPGVVLVAYAGISTPPAKFIHLPLNIILALIFLGVFCLGIAHWFYLEGLSRKGATDVGVFIYLEPIVTTMAAIPILNERPTLFAMAGIILIISGVYLVQRKSHFNNP